MSFGFSVGDFATLGQLTWTVYKACKDAPDSFKNISQEVLSLHAVLKELDETYADASLPAAQQSRLEIVGDGCRAVLKDLQGCVDKYNSLGTSSKRTWDRLQWGSEDIAELRSRLVSNTVLLTTFINTSQIMVQKKLDMFLQELREGKREGSIQTVDSLSRDERQAWRAIRKELQDIGISIAAFDANKDFIVDWFKTAISTGTFAEELVEKDGSSSIQMEVDPSEPSGGPRDKDTLSRRLEDERQDLLTSSVKLQTPKLSSKAKYRSRRPPRVAALVNWLFGSNAAKIDHNLAEIDRNSAQIDYNPATELIKAVETGDEKKALIALEKGADVNIKISYLERTPLHIAVTTGNRALLRILLENGADINAKDILGYTALTKSKNAAMVSILMENESNIGASDSDGFTALHEGAKFGNETLVRFLLDHGANVNEKTKFGFTALHLVAMFGHSRVAELLLQSGANINERNSEGETAFDLAVHCQKDKIAALLS